MNFSGNVLQSLDILSKFSQKQIKTIEAALSSSPDQQSFSDFFDLNHQPLTSINCQTPPTWTESETTTSSLADFDELVDMNNLNPNKAPAGAAASAAAAGVTQPPPPPAAVAHQFAEYLAMQQQAQELHQQQTQLQNRAVAAAAAAGHGGGQVQQGHYLGSRGFDATGQMKAGPGHGGVPPLAMSQQQPPQQMMAHNHPPPLLTTLGGGGGGPHAQQRQPLALTSSNVGRSADHPSMQANAGMPGNMAPVAVSAAAAASPLANTNHNEAPAAAAGSNVQTVS